MVRWLSTEFDIAAARGAPDALTTLRLTPDMYLRVAQVCFTCFPAMEGGLPPAG